jgi:hypothetical protein
MPVSLTLSAIALGIALSATCGFRVFVPMLAASLMGYLGWYPPAQGMEWLASLPALICFGTAAVLEILAYYIPFVDNLLDTIGTPLAVAAGTVLAAAFLPVDEGMMRWIAAMLAGGVGAGTIHAGLGFIRLLSSKTTGGAGNAVVATTENAAAVGMSAFSMLVPVLAAVLMIGLVGYIFFRMAKKLQA